MSDENNVVPFPQDPDDEKARRVIAEAQRLARLPRDDWQAQLSDCAKSLDIEQGELVQKGTGALDREDAEQEARYQFYFGSNRKVSATPGIESFTVQELASKGYRIPSWRNP